MASTMTGDGTRAGTAADLDWDSAKKEVNRGNNIAQGKV